MSGAARAMAAADFLLLVRGQESGSEASAP